jgi:hypothetical protein
MDVSTRENISSLRDGSFLQHHGAQDAFSIPAVDTVSRESLTVWAHPHMSR